MKKVKLLVVGLLSVAMLFVTACGTAPQVAEKQDAAQTVAPTVEKKADSTTLDFKGKKITALFMSGMYADSARTMVSDFEKTTGGKAEVLDLPYATLHEKVLLDFTSNTGAYDVISNACQWDGEFAPYVEPLAPYLQKSKLDTAAFIDNVFNNAGKWQGTIIGIPQACSPYMMAYRKDLVTKLPTTWDEYLDIAKKYTDPAKGMYGIAVPASKSQFGSLFDIRLWSMGGEWADENWKASISSPEGRKAFEHCKEMLKYADPAALSWGINEANNAFLQGKAVFCESWPALGVVQNGDNANMSKIAGKWDIAPFPTEKTGLTVLSAWDLTINKNSKVKDLAWEFINMYVSADKQMDFYKKFQIPSARKDFWQKDEVKNSKFGSMFGELENAIIWWRIPASNEAITEIKNGLASYQTGEMDLDAAIKYADTAVTRALANNPPPKDTKNNTAVIVKSRTK